jgi:hypothetical protein
MRTAFATLSLAAAVAAAAPVFPGDHLVSPQAAQRRLLEQRAAREDRQAALDRVLGSPEAAAAAGAVGTDLDRVRAAAATLSDEDLAELAARAAALQSDPVAALDSDIRTLLTIFLIVAIVILVLQAVD